MTFYIFLNYKQMSFRLLINVLFLFAIFNLNIVSALGQKKYSVPNTRTVYLTPEGGKIEATIDIKKKAKVKPEKFYSWFDNTSIHQTQGGYSHYLLHGPYLRFSYPDNQLVEKGNYKTGVKNGVWLCWYDNGVLKEKCNWKNGNLNGRKEFYDRKGQLLRTEIYKNNDLVETTDNKIIPAINSQDSTKAKKDNFFARTYTAAGSTMRKIFKRKKST